MWTETERHNAGTTGRNLTTCTAKDIRRRANKPLCLSVQFLPSGQSGFAVWLWSSTLGWLAICVAISGDVITHRANGSGHTFRLLLVAAEIFEEVELAQWAG